MEYISLRISLIHLHSVSLSIFSLTDRGGERYKCALELAESTRSLRHKHIWQEGSK